MYHVPVLKTSLNKNLAAVMPSVVDEMMVAFEEELDSKLQAPGLSDHLSLGSHTALISSGWSTLKVTDIFTRIACRMSNRAFIGLPLCKHRKRPDFSVINSYSGRVPEYCATVEGYAVNVVLGGAFLNCFPDFLKP